MLLPSRPCHHCPKLHLVTSHYLSDSSLNYVVVFRWEMLPGPGSACYCASMSWLSLATPHFTDSVWQIQNNQHHIFILILHIIFAPTLTAFISLKVSQFSIFYQMIHTHGSDNNLYKYSWGLFVLFSSLNVHKSPPYWSQSLEHFLSYLPVRHLNITLDLDVYLCH